MKAVKDQKKSKGTALVTGASRGIGKAIAAALAADGWAVTGTSRNPKRMSAEERVPGVRYLPLDISRRASIDALVRKVRGVDLLVNNAGASAIGSAEDTAPEDVRALFDSNYFGPVRLTQALLPSMRRKRRGTIIFIGSMAEWFPRAFSGFYAGTKAAMRTFSESLRLEVRQFDIRVALVAPWLISTNMLMEKKERPGSPFAASIDKVKQVRDRLMLASPGPEVVAEAVMDLLGKRWPRSFTSVGHRARLQAFVVRHLPRRIIERLSARQFKL